MDFRPSNGQLYALGYDSVAAAPAPNAQLYTLNPANGATAPVGSAVRLELGRRTARIGFDFNPVADLIRVVSTTRAMIAGDTRDMGRNMFRPLIHY